MPAPNEMVWYKWFPVKAMTSVRFATLTLEEEGFYRRLYDLASIAQPSIRRGWVYEHDKPATIKEIGIMLKTGTKRTEKFLKLLAERGLVIQDNDGAWGFPNFAKHQRRANLRPRADGLGSAETGTDELGSRDKTGTKTGALSASASKDVNDVNDVNAAPASQNRTPATKAARPSAENQELSILVQQFVEQTHWSGNAARVRKELLYALKEGFDSMVIQAAIQKAEVGSKPWDLLEALRQSRKAPRGPTPEQSAARQRRQDTAEAKRMKELREWEAKQRVKLKDKTA
ncbi:MAG: hypothetical protein KAY24_19520 [Candidatus Eisenbacteria sp.]|nr:hypothetical protein [Candidatus Eisenbacteria bacterium]